MATETKRRPGGARPNGPLLERSQIIDAAVALTADNGLPGVSMRQLGDRLGVTSMAIYWYIENRRELVDAVADQVVATAEVPTDDLPWDEWLRRTALSLHEVLAAHPGVADHLLSTASPPPSLGALRSAALARLTGAGFGRERAALSLAVLDTFVLGRAQLDGHRARGAESAQDGQPDRDGVLRHGVDMILGCLRSELG